MLCDLMVYVDAVDVFDSCGYEGFCEIYEQNDGLLTVYAALSKSWINASTSFRLLLLLACFEKEMKFYCFSLKCNSSN